MAAGQCVSELQRLQKEFATGLEAAVGKGSGCWQILGFIKSHRHKEGGHDSDVDLVIF